jgi:WD40 repeat protein
MNGANNAAFSPDGKRLISVGSVGEVKLWDITTRRELMTLSGEAGHPWLAHWTADGHAFFHGAHEAWRAPSLEEIAVIEARQNQAERR